VPSPHSLPPARARGSALCLDAATRLLANDNSRAERCSLKAPPFTETLNREIGLRESPGNLSRRVPIPHGGTTRGIIQWSHSCDFRKNNEASLTAPVSHIARILRVAAIPFPALGKAPRTFNIIGIQDALADPGQEVRFRHVGLFLPSASVRARDLVDDTQYAAAPGISVIYLHRRHAAELRGVESIVGRTRSDKARALYLSRDRLIGPLADKVAGTSRYWKTGREMRNMCVTLLNAGKVLDERAREFPSDTRRQRIAASCSSSGNSWTIATRARAEIESSSGFPLALFLLNSACNLPSNYFIP